MVLLVVAATLQAQAVEAAAFERGYLAARAGGRIPDEATISVQSDEGDDRSAVLAQAISRTLMKQGFQVSDGGALIFQFRIDNFDIAERAASSLKPEADDESSDQTRIGALDQTMIEPGRETRPNGLGNLHIEFFLFKNGHPPIWTATIEAPRKDQDEARQLEHMVALAMDAFGKTEESLFDVFQ
jgi:hypothetical protein